MFAAKGLLVSCALAAESLPVPQHPHPSVLPVPPSSPASAALSTPLKSECASCPVGWKGPWLLETVLGNTFL